MPFSFPSRCRILAAVPAALLLTPLAVFRTAAQPTPDGNFPDTMHANLDRLQNTMR